jgi:hypothetical protein
MFAAFALAVGAAHAQTFEPNAMGGLSYRDPNTGMLVGNAPPNAMGGYTFNNGGQSLELAPNAMGGLSYRDPNTGMLVGNARPNVNGGYTFNNGCNFC